MLKSWRIYSPGRNDHRHSADTRGLRKWFLDGISEIVLVRIDVLIYGFVHAKNVTIATTVITCVPPTDLDVLRAHR